MDKKTARIIFMGTPEISAKVLEGLVLDGYNIVALIAQPDRLVGRKKILTPVPTKVVAEKYNIPVYQPEKIRKDYEFVKEINPDLILTLAYGQIVPQGLLDIPSLGCINLHGSLLPKYRGAAPIQYALKNNDIKKVFTKKIATSWFPSSKHVELGLTGTKILFPTLLFPSKFFEFFCLLKLYFS